jgi:hypothetical protein
MKNILLLCFVFLNSFINAQYVGTGVFTRIQSTADLTNGYYVITSGTSNAMSNTFGGLFFSPANFTEVGNTIINPPTSIVWKIETNGTFRTIKSENLSKFLSFAGEANNMQFVDDVTSDNQKWAVTDNSSIFFITNAVFTNQRLSYYPEFSRWACYPGTQIHPRLYRLETTLTNETFIKNNFSIDPNPVKDFISLQNENNLPIDKIDVFDISGKKVLEDLKISETINVEKLSAGVYFLKINSKGKIANIKFVKT